MSSVKISIPLKGLASGKSKPKIDAIGFTGDLCKVATARFVRALGGGTSGEENKPELYLTQDVDMTVDA